MNQSDDTLKTEQYRNSQNLEARIALHVRFSQNPYGWFHWVFDQFELPAECTLLELGCGPGGLWRENCERIPLGWQLTLSDFSPGMLADCRENLAGCSHPFAFEMIDAQQIPRPDASLDAVIANHMLYHVPDRRQALGEIHRVLKPGGVLFTSTVGESHMHELDNLARKALVEYKTSGSIFSIDFTLENGAGELAGWFEAIRLERYEDALVVTEAEPIVAYVFSGRGGQQGADRRAAFLRFVEQEIQRSGAIHISKDSGMFITRKALA